MLSYCLKCRKKTKNQNPKVVSTKNWRIMFLSKCVVCNSKKKPKFLKEKEARGLLRNLSGIKIPVLSALPILNAFL